MRIEYKQSDLLAVLDAQERRPHVYGQSDCLLNAAEVVKVVTGTDYGADFRGKYKTLAGAYRVLKAAGHDGFIEYIASLGFEEIHHSAAADGDLGAIMQDGHWSFGNIIGPYLFLTAQSGRAIKPRDASERTFRVK